MLPFVWTLGPEHGPKPQFPYLLRPGRPIYLWFQDLAGFAVWECGMSTFGSCKQQNLAGWCSTKHQSNGTSDFPANKVWQRQQSALFYVQVAFAWNPFLHRVDPVSWFWNGFNSCQGIAKIMVFKKDASFEIMMLCLMLGKVQSKIPQPDHCCCSSVRIFLLSICPELQYGSWLRLYYSQQL